LDKQILSWSKTLAGKKNFPLIGAARRVLSSRASPLCGIGRAILKSLARVISRRRINLNSDKNSGPRQRDEGARAAGKRIKGWICKVGLLRSQNLDIGLKAHLFLFRHFTASFCPLVFIAFLY